jgi:hypothetical protein
MEAIKLKAQVEQQKEARGMQMDQAKLQIQAAAEEHKQALQEKATMTDLQMKQIEHIQRARQADEEHKAGLAQSALATRLDLVTKDAKARQQMTHAHQKQQLSKENVKNGSNKSK